MIAVTLISSDAVPDSGWGRMTHDLCRALEARRDEVSVELLLPVNAPRPTGLRSVVRYELPEWTGTFRRRPRLVLSHLRPRLSIEADVVHVMTEFPFAVTAWRALRRGVPYIVTGQGTYTIKPLLRAPERWFFRRALAGAAAVTVPSRFTEQLLVRHGPRTVSPIVLPNPVNPDARARRPQSDVRAALGVPPHARLIVSVGALKRRKGMDLLVDAFAALPAESLDTYLVIVGRGDTATLERQISERGLEERVVLAGFVDDAMLKDLYRSAEVFALLPRNDDMSFEGFGLVYLEAAAAGVPSVASASGGAPDAVVDGETGYVVPEEDSRAAARAMERLLGDSELRTRMGQAAVAFAGQNSWGRYADSLIDLYKQVSAESAERTSHQR